MGGLATPDSLSREGSPGPEYVESVGTSSNHNSSSLSLHAHHYLNENGGKVSQSAPGSPKQGKPFAYYHHLSVTR